MTRTSTCKNITEDVNLPTYGNIPINHYNRTTFFFSYYINGNTTEFHSFCEQHSSWANHISAIPVCANFLDLIAKQSKHSKQNEQSEDDPNDDFESQLDDNSTNEEDEIPQSQSEFDRWNKLLQQAYYSLQDTFDETCETYLEQNPGMEIAEAERKTFDE